MKPAVMLGLGIALLYLLFSGRLLKMLNAIKG